MFADIVSGNRRRSGHDLELRSRRVAGGLSAAGLVEGNVVALLMRNDFPFIEVTLGADRAGVVAVSLNWHASSEELLHVLEDSGAKALFVHSDLFERLRAVLPPRCKVVIADVPPEIATAYNIPASLTKKPSGLPGYEEWLAASPADIAHPSAAPYRLQYTSGSTGMPKGVVRRRGTDERAAASMQVTRTYHGLTDRPLRALMTGPLYHSAPNVYALNSVRHGELLVLQPKFDADALLSLIETHSITHMHVVPTMFSRLLALPADRRQSFDASSLRSVVHGAARCPLEIKRAMINWFGPILREYYAATETGIICGATSQEWLDRPGTVGRAAEGVELRIVDERGDGLPVGEAGEIYISNDAFPLMSYRNLPDATAEIRRGRWITMGDIGHMDSDGFLWISDRKKDLVISGGVNIFPAEVEQALTALPGIRDCIVFGIPDTDLGEALGACIELDEQTSLTAQDIKSFLGERLGRLRVPKAVQILDRLPREDTGKLARRKARTAFLQSLELDHEKRA